MESAIKWLKLYIITYINKMIFNIPNSLTLLRIALIPIMVFLVLSDSPSNRILASLLFLLAAITDYLDGLIARQMRQHTNFGEFLDPIADKLLVIIILVLLLSENNQLFFLLPAIIIITREFLVVAIRQRLAELGNKIILKVTTISKIKTATQLTALFLLLYKDPLLMIDTYNLGVFFLQIASILTLISFIYYVKKSWNDII
ncbi:MAG: CDP-diacylglycerol--glycerol-3-phosphate 3-phosphatidyltransferase [Gammaproteobacteria bacterium]|nr:CDP-diacylglycerol--glycerol-3-phosphate 3-phosphatidyltransferase [Gammaproteobacteria bacterium]|tara:strand:+ start:1098 stop:1703 length:606 start_codon:yes stop_codon:yes gene_type:complete